MSPLTAKDKIARLEEILARVKTRAGAPRPVGVAAAPAARVPTPAAPPVAERARAYSPPAPPVAPSPPSPPTAPPPTPAVNTANTSPPPTEATSWSPPAGGDDDATEIGYANADLDVDVEVSAEVVEVDIDVDEATAMPAESGAQPVAASVPSAELIDEPVRTEPSHRPPAEPEVPANEVVEPAPSSSPRPIEPPAYEEESAPRHTPPPESGKQVAVAPSSPPRRASEPPSLASTPPPSLEGHTLVGGWREPGIPAATGSHPGVRVPPPAGSGSVPDVSQTRLSPEVTRAELPGAAKVASFEGTVAPFKPASFGELLDASLGL